MYFWTINNELKSMNIKRRLKKFASEIITNFDELLKYAAQEQCINDLILKHDFISSFCNDQILTDYLTSILKDNFISASEIFKVLKNTEVIERIKRRLFNNICAEFNDDLIPSIIRRKYKIDISNKSMFLTQYKKFCIRYSNCDELLMKLVEDIIKDLADTYDEVLYYENIVHPKNFIYVDDDKLIGSSIVVSSIDPILFASAGRTSPLVIIGDNVLTGSSQDHHQDLVDRFKRTRYKELTGKDLPKDLDEDIIVGYDIGYDEVLKLLQESTCGVGSIFGKVALLEFVSGLPNEIVEGQGESNSGNIDRIKNTLKAAGFKKVYINQNGAWTSRKYLRIAKRLFKKMCKG